VSGIVLGAQIQKVLHSINFVIYEKSDAAGGTWFHNRYPQAACDVQSHLYSISFERKLDWSESYSPASEICDYLQDVAKKHNVMPFVEFGVEMIGAEWQKDTQTWKVALKRLRNAKDGRPGLRRDNLDGDDFFDECNFLILGGGGLHFPNVPHFVGMESFKGDILHTASFPDNFSFVDKRVAVVGTGASGVQVVQGVADEVKELVIYQRTPGWILPKNQYRYTSFHKALLKLPLVELMYRWFLYLYADLVVFKVMYQGAPLNKWFTDMMLAWYKQEIQDDALREKITPKYPLGCKRILPTINYLQILQRKSTRLVTDPIQSFGEGGIVTKGKDGTSEIAVDVIVLATGFETNGMGPNVPIQGPDASLKEIWSGLGGPEAYLNVTQSGMPNLFFTLGPNSGTGHMSAMNTIECQVDYILDLIRQCRDEGIRSVDAKEHLQREWSQFQQTQLDKFVWHAQPGCNSWYRGGANEGKSSVLLPMSATEYWWKIRRADLKSYNIVKDPLAVPTSTDRLLMKLKRLFGWRYPIMFYVALWWIVS
jgi:cation diffusion facilitator CzcD-associated flavoprotein CzcO